MAKQPGSELFIVDNSDDEWKVGNYIRDFCQISESIDIATGYFEIGSLLSLKDQWQAVDRIRILMGDEVLRRTKQAFEAGLADIRQKLDDSLEHEKQKNDFLTGVPAVVEAIRSGKIQCRVYRKQKFHAKAFITHSRIDVVGANALVGSSNFTFPGLWQNVELNVQIAGRQVTPLQEWYEQHWNDAEDVTPEILQTIERHTRPYSPFEVYARSLQEFFRGHEMTATEWERNVSKIYPLLARYQQEAYHGLLKRSKRYRGALLCDGVGLGKTFVGLMLIERLVKHDHQNVALFVPKAARVPVWESTLKKYLPELFGRFNNLEIFNHTDLLRAKMQDDLDSVRDRADVILIDEAHHFRNTGTRGEDETERQSRYWRMFDIAEGKSLYLLTATPVNNRLTDFQHMVELFSRRQTDYFKEAPLGIHSLAGHIRTLEKELEAYLDRKHTDSEPPETNLAEAEVVLGQDQLFQELVVQRSREYVKRSLQGDAEVLFPKRNDPKVVPYSVKQTYGKLLRMLEDAFSKEKPLFALPIYYPYFHYCGDDESIDPLKKGRQNQVVSLIRTLFLKRFESSAEAFRQSCWTLLRKLLAWVEVHAETKGECSRFERWKQQHAELIGYVHEKQQELFGGDSEDDVEEDLIPEELLEAVVRLDRDEFDVAEIINETLLDLDQIAAFLGELQNFKPSQDKKLRGLIKLLRNDPVLKSHKVLLFTEFLATARYLRAQLEKEGFTGVHEIDSQSKVDRGRVIRQFSPYYNGSSSGELAAEGLDEIRILISTDVLSEGLNLQDATRIINYDLHWNPVRLMQRIGRVDRRLNPHTEKQILADHPDQKRIRGEVAYWNFLPPDELDELLKLYSKVAHKTLRISRTFGIEGRKLLTPQDEYEDLKNFNEAYEGSITPVEELHLELQRLFEQYPDLEQRLAAMPNRIFSGKEHPKTDTQRVFFCYALPAHELGDGADSGNGRWSIEAGRTQWYLYDIASGDIHGEPTEMIDAIRSTPETPRRCQIEQQTLADIRAKIDKHIKNSYLKKVQAPVGVQPVLRAWMELN